MLRHSPNPGLPAQLGYVKAMLLNLKINQKLSLASLTTNGTSEMAIAARL